MPFNGSGSFSAPVISGWPAVSGAVISSTAMNAVINDIISGLSAVLVRDGQSAMTGDLDMGGNAVKNTTFVREAKASDLPSAATCDIGGAAGRFVDITGTTTITSFGTSAAGTWKLVRFMGALTLTHHATNLILPGGANITTAAGDTLVAASLGAGKWVVMSYQKAVVTPPGYVPVNKAGDTMTGSLTLNAAPTVDLHAATKKYVDDGLAGKSDTSHTHAWSAITSKGLNEGANTQDPNTTQSHVITTNHANTPDSTYYWHITTTFYSTLTGNRAQIAVQYSGGAQVYARSHYSGTWQAWVRCDLGEVAKSHGSTGYHKLPGGLILQWGTVSLTDGGSSAITFPLAFNACVSVQMTVTAASAGNYGIGIASSVSASGFTARLYNGAGNSATFYWFAVGY